MTASILSGGGVVGTTADIPVVCRTSKQKDCSGLHSSCQLTNLDTSTIHYLGHQLECGQNQKLSCCGIAAPRNLLRHRVLRVLTGWDECALGRFTGLQFVLRAALVCCCRADGVKISNNSNAASH